MKNKSLHFLKFIRTMSFTQTNHSGGGGGGGVGGGGGGGGGCRLWFGLSEIFPAAASRRLTDEAATVSICFSFVSIRRGEKCTLGC